ncbi:MAG: hypothetical protein RIG68_20775 [Imperialibacter sp.]|uniref:hypothetical protein n=1 Tax=Imperialibacter sp. TaxID=2038411 RepID=UPI0032EEEE21
MNYSKNTLTPIADAARFFHEIKGRIRYEERKLMARGRELLSKRAAPGDKNQSGDRMIKMEYL